jgi:hypothetical protein
MRGLLLNQQCPVCRANGRPDQVIVDIFFVDDTFTCAAHTPWGWLAGTQHTADELESCRKTDKIACVDPNYPGTCTRCKKPAYVGLNEIDHKDPARNKVCR